MAHYYSITLEKALSYFVTDPRNAVYNFLLGQEYEKLGHNGSALSFYLRAAEHSSEDLLSYESMLRVAICLEKAGERTHSLQGALLRAISLMPERPEAYFLLSRSYERTQKWHDAYAFAVLGEKKAWFRQPQLRSDVGYPGSYGLTFERAVTAWWIGLYDESMHLFRKLEAMPGLKPEYVYSIDNNLANYGCAYKKDIRYDNLQYQNLRYKFPGAEVLTLNHSQLYQDIFVLSMLQGKRNGTWVEIGASEPWYNSNTALLETEFDWHGISIEIDPAVVERFNKDRKVQALCADASQLDYDELLTEDVYDYLQVDCEPATTSFEILKRIPFNRCKFAVVTFEHDNYIETNKEIMTLSRKFMESHGYKLVVNNVSPDRFAALEDWWVHPELVDPRIVGRMLCISDKPKRADDYILNKI